MLLFSSILSSFIDDKDNPKKKGKHSFIPSKSPARPFDADPIKFTLQADKRTASVGEEITFTITAHYLNIPSALLFTAAGSTTFRLKVLLPDGFVQTGGDYIDYIGTELSPIKSTVVYTLKGYFSKSGSNTEFRLLRSHGHADASSLFVEKARLSIQATVIDLSQQSQKSAREGSCNYSEGQFLFTTSWGESVYAHYYNGILFAAAQNGHGFKPQHWLVATGQMTASIASCFAENDPHTTTTNPTTNPPTGTGSLAFQIVSYDCNSGVLQYKFSSSDNATVNVTMPGIFGGTMNSNTVASTTFPSDAKVGRTVTGTASQSGNQISINFTTSCNLTTPSTNPTTNPPTGNCPYTEGQYLFTFQNAEAIYAHFYNGVLFAAYQDGSNFKPQHWLVATGLMTASVANCFAENDPHTTTTNPPTGGGNGNGLVGNYFNNTSLSGTPVLSRIEATINFTWDGGGSSPSPGVPASNMSARWEGQVEAPATGTYTFSTNNDDATQLWVNGQQLISDWPGGHAPTLKSGTISLQAGQKYSIKLEFNQGSGGAQAQLLWAYPGQGQQIIPQSRLYSTTTTTTPTSSCGTGSGLTGFYTNSHDLSQHLAAIRNDNQINFTWSDSPIPGIVNPDGFSIRWFGQVEAPVSGNYTFKTNNDDGSRVWVNSQLLINDWNGHGPTWQQGSIYLNAGKYTITIDFADFGGGAQAQLYWEYPNQSLQLIPSCRLYSIVTYNQTRQTYRSDDDPCPGEGIEHQVWGGCAEVYACNPSGRIFEMNLQNCEQVTGPSGGTPPGGTPPEGAPPGDTPNGTPISGGDGPNGVGGPGSVPGGPTKPGIPIFGLPISTISPIFIDKPIDNYTGIEQVLILNRIYRELGITSIDQLEQPPYLPPILFPYWLDQMHQVSREYSVLKQMNPGWSSFKCMVQAYQNVYSGKVHFLLDVFGTVPGAGEIADGVNGGIYLLEGDKTNAALSFAATIPIAGWAATGGKWAKKGLQAVGSSTFVSAEGLVWAGRKYGTDPANIHALSHVYRHFDENLTRPIHGIFTVPTNELVELVDEAWIKIQNNVPGVVKNVGSNGNITYSIPMGRDIGKQGGSNGSGNALNKIKIIIDGKNPNNIVTAYPE